MASAKIVWDDRKMSVNIEEIDTQHQALVRLINNMADTVTAGQSRRVFEKQLSDFMRYIELHFSDEETYFTLYDYPEASAHRGHHKAFFKQVSALKNEFHSKETELSRVLLNFIKDWLVHHIVSIDKKYSKFFNDQGLQ